MAAAAQPPVCETGPQPEAGTTTFLQSVFTLCSTAMGGGVLTMAYMMRLSGVAGGITIAILSGMVSLLGIGVLMLATLSSRKSTFASLLSYYTGPLAQPALDMMLFIYGNGAMVAYFIFLGDFLPKLAADCALPSAFQDRTVLLLVTALLVLPMVLQRELAVLSKIAPVSLVAVVYTGFVIMAKAPGLYNQHEGSDEFGTLEMFNLDWGFFKALAIQTFAYNCHLNVVPVASKLASPTPARMWKVALASVLVQLIFYMIIAMAGYASFLKKTHQDVLEGYTEDDIPLVISRLLLTFSIMVSIAVNLNPTIQSGLDFHTFFQSRRGTCQVPHVEADSSTARTTSSGSPLVSLEIVDEDASKTSGDTLAHLRVILGITCVIFEVTVAILVPMVADVISLLGATCGTMMMIVIPAIVLRRSSSGGAQARAGGTGAPENFPSSMSFYALCLASGVMCISVLVLVLEFFSIIKIV